MMFSLWRAAPSQPPGSPPPPNTPQARPATSSTEPPPLEPAQAGGSTQSLASRRPIGVRVEIPDAEASEGAPARTFGASATSSGYGYDEPASAPAALAGALGRRGSEEGRTSPRLPKGRPAKQRQRHRKVRAGVTVFKGHPSYSIMMNVKLGIAYSSGREGARRMGPLTSKDFKNVFSQTFPHEGSSTTPAHSTKAFQFKDHAPLAFRHLREHFGISEQDYQLSICGENSLRELGTPGKSGAVFYLTEDFKFLIKTVSKKESKFLRRMLPNYYAHVMTCESSTLLPRFYGLIRITTQLGRNIRMVVMNNLMPEEALVHEKYDLKGSTLGRYATDAEKRDPNVTLKDLDWRHALTLPAATLAPLKAQFESDAAFLRELRIMDYSLLAMLHFPARAADDDEWDALPSPDGEGVGEMSYARPYDDRSYDELSLQAAVQPGEPRGASAGLPSPVAATTDARAAGGAGAAAEAGAGARASRRSSYAAEVFARLDGDGDGIISPEDEASFAKRLGGIALAGGARRQGAALAGRGGTPPIMGGADPKADGESESEDESEDVAAEMRLPSVTTTELSVAYEKSQARGRREPVAAVHVDDGIACRIETGEEVLLFCGIIDILQQYGARKQLEHRYKALRYRHNRAGISVTDPGTYSSRFLSFILGSFAQDAPPALRGTSAPTELPARPLDPERGAGSP